MLIIIESDAGPEPRASESNFIIIIFSLSEPTRTPEAESDDSCHLFSESRFSGKLFRRAALATDHCLLQS